MAGVPAGFGVTITDGTPALYGFGASDYTDAITFWNNLIGSPATAGKIFFGPSLYPTTLTGFPAAARLQGMINQGFRIHLCYQPGAQTDAGVDTYTNSNPAFVNQTTAQRSSLVASVSALAAACVAAGTGAVIASVSFYSEANANSKNLAPGSGGNDGGYIGCVNFYGNSSTGVKSIAGTAGFLAGATPRLGFYSIGGSPSNAVAYFQPGAAQTTAYDVGFADYYGTAYMSGERMDAATNGIATICNALAIPVGIGEMGPTATGTITTNGNIVSYIQEIQRIFVAQLAANHNTADVMFFDGFVPVPVVRTVASGAGTVVGSATNTTLKTTTAWPAGQPGTNRWIQIGSEIMQVTAGSGTTSVTVTRAQQGTAALSNITAGMSVTTIGSSVIYLPGDFRIPYLRALITAITASGGTSGAFTQRQDSATLFVTSGNFGAWFNQVGGTGSAAGSLLVARFATDDGSQTITAPAGWVKVSSPTDASTGAGTTGVARAQIWAYTGNPGGLAGSVSYTANNASPCTFTVTGAAPMNGTPVCLSGAFPGGFSTNAGTVYYVVSSSGSTFELAATVSGTPLNSTAAVTTGGVLAFPQVFTCSNTSCHVRGHLTEWTTPTGTTQVADQLSPSTAHGTGTTMALTCGGANTQAGGMATAVIGCALTGGTTGQSVTIPGAPWVADGNQNNATLTYNAFSQNNLAAGTTAGTSTLVPGTWAETGWAGAMVTFYASTAAGAPLNITTLTLPNGAVTVAYSQTLATSGGTAPVTWGLNLGSQPLPSPLTLTAAGVLAGTPTAGGVYAFTVLATDALGNTDTQDLTLTITGGPQITTTSPLPAGTVGTAYSQALAFTGGTGPYTSAVTSGALPGGVALSASTFTGTPTVEGTATFNVTVTDNVAATGVKTFTLTIAPASTGPSPPDGGTRAVFPPGWPQIIVEAGFYAANPVAPPGTFILSDPVNGILGTNTLGDRTAWTDITLFVRSGTTTRASTRVQGPLRTYQAGTASVVLKNGDARFDPDNLAGPYVTGGVTNIRPMVPVRARAIYNNTEYGLFSGFADNWNTPDTNYGPLYAETTVSATDGFKILAGVTLPATAPLGAGELSGARIARILSNASWFTDHRRIDDGDSALQATAYGDTALNLLQLTADSEGGELYIDGAGNVTFRERQAAISAPRSITPQAVFGDGGGTELPYTGVGRANDDTQLCNDVQITNANTGTLQEAASAASIAKYLFPRSYARSDILLQTDPEAFHYAQWVLYVSLAGEDRFDTLTLNPQRDARLWPHVLGREIGDLITIIRRPPGMGTITKNVFIRGITHTVDASAATWQTVWDLQDASRYAAFLKLDDPVLGQLTEGNKLSF